LEGDKLMFPLKLVFKKMGEVVGVIDLQRVQAIQLAEQMETASRDLKVNVIVLGIEPAGLSFAEGRASEKPVILGLSN
jgi:hypothetical protein